MPRPMSVQTSASPATGLSLSGAAAGNYQLSTTSAFANVGTITPKTLTPTLTGPVSKVYDGTTAASLNGPDFTLPGVVGSDAVTLISPTSGTMPRPMSARISASPPRAFRFPEPQPAITSLPRPPSSPMSAPSRRRP